MKAERFRQIEAIFHAALERAPAERKAFLIEACSGDEELKREVDSLLTEVGHLLMADPDTEEPLTGFNPDDLPDPLDPENLERPSGRGVFLIRHYMTWVRYNPRGNCVTLCKGKSAK